MPEGNRIGVGRLFGLRRGGPEPPQTRAGAPLRPFTIPNLIGYVRIGLLGAFVAVAFSTDDGRDPFATTCYVLAATSDYLDGIAARVTGQYSRLGALMDPLIDRLVVIAGVAVVWHFELLPRWGLAVLIAREVFMLGAVLAALRAGLDLHINWIGRIAVWPTMSAVGAALFGWDGVDEAFLYLGIAGSIAATVQYGIDARRELRARRESR
jgi:cardiolipin synthase